MNLSQYSNDDLLKIAGQKPDNKLTDFSDEDLMKIANIKPSQKGQIVYAEEWSPEIEAAEKQKRIEEDKQRRAQQPKGFFGNLLTGENVGATAMGMRAAKTTWDMTPQIEPRLRAGLSFASGVLGAFAGGFLGKDIDQVIDDIKGIKQLPAKWKDRLAEDLKAGKNQAFWETMGIFFPGAQITGRTAKGLIAEKIVQPKTIPGAPRLSNMLSQKGREMLKSGGEIIKGMSPYHIAELQKRGVRLTPAQQAVSRGVDMFENALDVSFFGGGKLFNMKKVFQPATIKYWAKDISEQIAKDIAGGKISKEQAGQIFKDAFEGSKKVVSEKTRNLYNELLSLKPDTRGAISEFVGDEGTNIAKRELRNKSVNFGKGFQTVINRIEKTIPDIPDVAGRAQFAKDMAEMKAKYGGKLSFEQAINARSDILEKVRNLETLLGGGKKGKLRGIADEFAGVLDSAMEKAANEFSPKAAKLWRNANDFVKTSAEEFNHVLLQKAGKLAQDPLTQPAIVDAVFKKGVPVEELLHVQKILGKDSFKKLGAAKLNDIFMSSYKELDPFTVSAKTKEGGAAIFDGESFLKNLYDMGDSLDIIVSKEHKQALFDLGNAALLSQADIGKKLSGGLATQLMQAGAVGGAVAPYKGNVITRLGSIAFLFAPPQLAKMMTDEASIKWLTEGLKSPASIKPQWFAKIPPVAARILKARAESQREQSKSPNTYYGRNLPKTMAEKELELSTNNK